MDEAAEQKLKRATPLVGVYIAIASAVCTGAMAADAFNGFRQKRLWFPSKFCSLNATSLTFLAAAMKLQIDLNTYMYETPADWLAKYVGILFMSTALANFMSSLVYVPPKKIRTNVIALGILVITVALKVLVQIFLLWGDLDVLFLLSMIPTILMLHLLIKFVSIAIVIPTTRRRLKKKYKEQHKIALSEEVKLEGRRNFEIDVQKEHMMKYWVMAETSSLQFVMARSVFGTTVICFLTTLALVLVIIWSIPRSDFKPESEYKSLTILIQVIQFIGVVVGSIWPTLRWFSAVYFKSTVMILNCFKKAFHIEEHWIQILTEVRDSFSGSQIRKNKYRKCLHDAKWFAITLCIVVQIVNVQLSRLLVTFPSLLCFIPNKIFVNRRADTNQNLKRYVVLLEGEPDLPERVLKDICSEADHMIQTGKKEQSQSLLRLLGQSVSFNGVRQFDCDRIPSLHSQEPPNCWTLPVATLTIIAVALPNIAKSKRELLVRRVNKGFSLAKIVEKITLHKSERANIRKAADICWVGVLFYAKWLGINLNRMSLRCRNSKEVLKKLSKRAKEIITKFKKEEKDPIMRHPRNWPTKVVAANSMYRISETILLSYQEEDNPADDELFERLSVMIADILAACLTNLPHVIITMCHRNTKGKGGKSLRRAFLLFGQTENVVEHLGQRNSPQLAPDKAAYIEEWRALLREGTV